MAESTYDVIIVGGGIGGTVLALALGLQKRRVLVLEKDLKSIPNQRPEILAKVTLQAFDRLGVGQRILSEAAIPLEGLEVCHPSKGSLFKLTPDDFKKVGARPHSTDPFKTRQILLEEMSRLETVTLLRGVYVENILKEGSKVVGVSGKQGEIHQEWRASMIVGDDGGNSILRHIMNIPIQIQTWAVTIVTTLVPGTDIVGEGRGQAYLFPPHINKGIFGCAALPFPGRQTALIFVLRNSFYSYYLAHPEKFLEHAGKIHPHLKKLQNLPVFPKGYGVFMRPFGHVQNYTRDGFALLGDAAHPVTPAGGQGANMSIADAMALSEIIRQAFEKNDFSEASLRDYEIMRRKANDRSLQFSILSNRIFRILSFFPFLGVFLPIFLKNAGKNPETKARFARTVSQTFLTSDDDLRADDGRPLIRKD